MELSTEVIVCTFNGEQFVVEQLRSILNQSQTVDSIVIQDDQSVDDTVGRIYTFINGLKGEDARKFQVRINEENLGYAQNFVTAIERSTADILFLCDQDDVWERDKVKVMVDQFV